MLQIIIITSCAIVSLAGSGLGKVEEVETQEKSHITSHHQPHSGKKSAMNSVDGLEGSEKENSPNLKLRYSQEKSDPFVVV